MHNPCVPVLPRLWWDDHAAPSTLQPPTLILSFSPQIITYAYDTHCCLLTLLACLLKDRHVINTCTFSFMEVLIGRAPSYVPALPDWSCREHVSVHANTWSYLELTCKMDSLAIPAQSKMITSNYFTSTCKCCNWRFFVFLLPIFTCAFASWHHGK